MPTLPCENGGGSLNNPNNPPTTPTTPYVPPNICVGQLELSSTNPDLCQQTDQNRQESYVAEALNISGAPINVYKLLGVHEQGTGSLLPEGTLVASQPSPGYPLSGVNTGSSWRSLEVAATTQNTSYIGIDFGIKRLASGQPEYKPEQSKWVSVAAVSLTQSNLPDNFARQVKVEYADGECVYAGSTYTGTGNGSIHWTTLGLSASLSTITAMCISATQFLITLSVPGQPLVTLGVATVDEVFDSPVISFVISSGSIPYGPADMFTMKIEYVWKRAGIFNVTQSPSPQVLNLQTNIRARAIRVTPTLYTAIGPWEVSAFDVLDSAPTDINNIQDLFFNENRDRDYAITPLQIKAQYSPADSASDLSRFGLGLLDMYSFTVSFATMVQLLGRPIVTGDILEVIPEMQYDHNLKPVRKFLEVTDTGWASEGYSTHWKPTVYRFSAQQALPSQETRDIFGTLDTQKYLVADSILGDNIGEQLDVTPLTQTEEIIKAADDAVPERGDNAVQKTLKPITHALPPVNPKGQPPAIVQPPAPAGKQNIYVEDGLPKSGEPYGEGFKLPDVSTIADGDYFRLYYPPETRIAPRLYRYSAVKNRWIFVEQDRRGDYSTHKPSMQSILQSNTKVGLGKKS